MQRYPGLTDCWDPCIPSLGIWKSPGSSRIQGYFWYLGLPRPTNQNSYNPLESFDPLPMYENPSHFPRTPPLFEIFGFSDPPRDIGTNTFRESRNGIRRLRFTCLGFIFTFPYKNAGSWNIRVGGYIYVGQIFILRELFLILKYVKVYYYGLESLNSFVSKKSSKSKIFYRMKKFSFDLRW